MIQRSILVLAVSQPNFWIKVLLTYHATWYSDEIKRRKYVRLIAIRID